MNFKIRVNKVLTDYVLKLIFYIFLFAVKNVILFKVYKNILSLYLKFFMYKKIKLSTKLLKHTKVIKYHCNK